MLEDRNGNHLAPRPRTYSNILLRRVSDLTRHQLHLIEGEIVPLTEPLLQNQNGSVNGVAGQNSTLSGARYRP